MEGITLFCEDRKHTILSITDNATNAPATVTDVVKLNDEYMFFTINAPDSSYIGSYTVEVQVTLHNFAFSSPMTQFFEVHVIASCNATEFITLQPLVDNFDDIGIRTGPHVKMIPQYALSTEATAAETGMDIVGESSAYGHCGTVSQTLYMLDGTKTLPSFIKVIEPDDESSSRLKIYVYATDEEEVGLYEFKIVTTLEDDRFQEGLVPQIDYFNVTIADIPRAEVNHVAYPRVHVADRLSLKLSETAVYDLYPEDPDGEDRDVKTEVKVLSDIARNLCPECFVWNERSYTFSVHANEVLAGMSVRFLLRYTDD